MYSMMFVKQKIFLISVYNNFRHKKPVTACISIGYGFSFPDKIQFYDKLTLGVKAFISKPFDIEQLKFKIKEIIG